MPPAIALCLCVGFVVWLFARDSRQHVKISCALWIPLGWVFIIGSRPASLWLGVPSPYDNAGVIQDSLVDKALYLFLIGAGLTVLVRRRLRWRNVIRNNKWLFAYFVYFGASVLWSDESLVAFKRWIKDFGNVVMVLVIVVKRIRLRRSGRFSPGAPIS
jgi:exopolysaccharide production protein ExoQ